MPAVQGVPITDLIWHSGLGREIIVREAGPTSMEDSSDSGFSLLEGRSGELRSPTIQSRAFRFIFHGFAATLGGPVIGLMLLLPFWNGAAHHQGFFVLLLAGSQYSPAFWGSGFLLGLVINDHMQNRSAQWVGPICVVLLLCGFLYDSWFLSHSTYFRVAAQGHFWRYEYDHLFSLDDRNCGGDECLGKFFGTLPVLTSIAYSAGAWLALRHAKKHDAGSTTEL